MKRYVAVVPLLVLISVPSALGQTGNVAPGQTFTADQLARRSLKGLKQFMVLTGSFGDKAQGAEISDEQLKIDVELPLRRAHLQVVDSADPALSVNVNAMRTPTGWAYAVSADLYQFVTLNRDKSISVPARTWHADMLGSAGDRVFVEGAREAVRKLVDRFLNDYLAENP